MTLEEVLRRDIADWQKIGRDSLLHRFLLEVGEAFEGRPFEGEMMEPGNCFENAMTFIAQSPHEYFYAEGVVYRRGLAIPMHHGWVVTREDNEVIDPTIQRPEECSYWGIALDPHYAWAEMKKVGYMCLFVPGEMFNFELMEELAPGILPEKVRATMGGNG